MTRSQLITKVANDTNMTAAEVEKVMDGIFGTIGDVLKSGDKVTIAGFGRFEMRERQTKNFTNPKTKVHPRLQGQRPPEGEGLRLISYRLIAFKDPQGCGSFFVCNKQKSLPC